MNQLWSVTGVTQEGRILKVEEEFPLGSGRTDVEAAVKSRYAFREIIQSNPISSSLKTKKMGGKRKL